MKAWRVESHGGIEVLQQKEIPTPVAGPGEARILVQAVSLNHMDLWVRKGVPGHRFPLPLTPGCDVAGRIESLGALTPTAQAALEARGLKIGGDVVMSAGVSCGACAACLGGRDFLCRAYGILGESRDGGLAEFMTVPIANLIPKPPTLTPEQAACLPVAFLTAWSMLVTKAQILPGQTLLALAGGSGVSIAALQIAKLLGATVVAAASTAEKRQKLLALGADHAIELKPGTFREGLKPVLTALGRKGFDIVLDHVGKETFSESLRALDWGGKLVTCGATSGGDAQVDLKLVFFKNLSILGTTMGSRADLFRIIELAGQGRLKAVIAQNFSWEELPQAHQALESRTLFGKAVLSRKAVG